MNSQEYTCHRGNRLAFRWQNINFFGGGISCGASFHKKMFVINCLDFNDSVLRLVRHEVVLNIPNHGVSDYTLAHWLGIVKEIKFIAESHKLGPQLDVLVMCGAGHGRTGMVLAILYGLFMGDCMPNAIAIVRRYVCKYSVENRKQIEYIEKILGENMG
jgi:hypothetical protein